MKQKVCVKYDWLHSTLHQLVNVTVSNAIDISCEWHWTLRPKVIGGRMITWKNQV